MARGEPGTPLLLRHKGGPVGMIIAVHADLVPTCPDLPRQHVVHLPCARNDVAGGSRAHGFLEGQEHVAQVAQPLRAVDVVGHQHWRAVECNPAHAGKVGGHIGAEV
jgi:hypothetical protein